MCIDCVHSGDNKLWCVRDAEKVATEINLVDGRQVVKSGGHIWGCASERSHGWLSARISGRCGREGRYFKPKSVVAERVA